MEKKFEDFSMQEALRLAGTDAGKQLLALLKQENTATLQQAADQAAAGSYDQVKNTLSAILSTPEAQALLKQLGGNQHG